MSGSDLFFYCGIAPLIYIKHRSIRLGPFCDMGFYLKVLDFDGGLEAFRSEDPVLFAGAMRCFDEMQEVFGIDVEGYVAHWARTFGVFLEEETEQSWFCFFEAPLVGYPFCMDIFYRRGYDYDKDVWVLDRCQIGIFPIPLALYERKHA